MLVQNKCVYDLQRCQRLSTSLIMKRERERKRENKILMGVQCACHVVSKLSFQAKYLPKLCKILYIGEM